MIGAAVGVEAGHTEGVPQCLDRMAESMNEPKMTEEKKLVLAIDYGDTPCCDGGCPEVVSVDGDKITIKRGNVDRTKFIPGVAEELRLTLVSKNGDYAPAGEFSNFEISAEFAGIQPFELILAQIGIKMTRISNLHHNDYGPNNESLRDSLLDLAGYGIIAAAWLDAVQASQLED